MKRSDVPRESGAVIGCYTVHLYCSHPEHKGFDVRWYRYDGAEGHSGNEFTGETEAECLTAARIDAGWWVSRRDATGRRAALCPYHTKEVPE